MAALPYRLHSKVFAVALLAVSVSSQADSLGGVVKTVTPGAVGSPAPTVNPVIAPTPNKALTDPISKNPKPAPMLTYAGKLIRSAMTQKVYLVGKTGVKHWIGSPQVFDACGLDWGAVEDMQDGVIDSIADSSNLMTAEDCRQLRPTSPNPAMANKLIQFAAEPQVYFVAQDGARHHVVSPAVFTACGFDWGRIEKLPANVVFAMPVTQPIASPNDCPRHNSIERPVDSINVPKLK